MAQWARDDGLNLIIYSADLTAARDKLSADLNVLRSSVGDRTGAEQLVNLQLFVEREALGMPDDEDEFFHADLIGLVARDEDGHKIGMVTGLFDFGAGDIIEVTPEATKEAPGSAKPLLLPFTKAVVPAVDIKAGHIVVILPEEGGAADENEETGDDER